jgi:hypothetical protein
MFPPPPPPGIGGPPGEMEIVALQFDNEANLKGVLHLLSPGPGPGQVCLKRKHLYILELGMCTSWGMHALIHPMLIHTQSFHTNCLSHLSQAPLFNRCNPSIYGTLLHRYVLMRLCACLLP